MAMSIFVNIAVNFKSVAFDSVVSKVLAPVGGLSLLSAASLPVSWRSYPPALLILAGTG